MLWAVIKNCSLRGIAIVGIVFVIWLAYNSAGFVDYFGHILGGNGSASIVSLERENIALRVELEKLLPLKDATEHFKQATISAAVYAAYPFGGKNEIVISAGSADGIGQGMPVLANNLLIGIVNRVTEHQGIVQTIFDTNFELPVAIGESAIKALFKGGSDPSITLIPQESYIRGGEGVYSVRANLPYGIPVGEVGAIYGKEGDAWKTAVLSAPCILRDVRIVTVITNFK